MTATDVLPTAPVYREPTLPISENFVSPQGEGFWTGVTHCFVRFAGCTVGKPYTPVEREKLGLHVYQERCRAWNQNVETGSHGFSCDTNYKMSERLTVSQIMGCIPANVEHVCLTGGEPLMHDLTKLMEALRDAKKKVHIETSGTIDFMKFDWMYDNFGFDTDVWVAVSPKANYLDRCIEYASELKVLVGDDFDESLFLVAFQEAIEDGKVYIQPINDEFTLDRKHVEKCLALQLKYPKLKLSIQLHKILNVR